MLGRERKGFFFICDIFLRVIILPLNIHEPFIHVVLLFRLADVYCQILILHDRDDEIISFELGKKVIIYLSCFPISL